MYIILTPWRVESLFERFSPFNTLYFIGNALYQPLSTSSGLILGAGANRASPGISIGRTAIVVVRTPYIWSYVSVLPYRWDFGPGNRTRDILPVFWSPHQGAGPCLLDLHQFKWVPNIDLYIHWIANSYPPSTEQMSLVERRHRRYPGSVHARWAWFLSGKVQIFCSWYWKNSMLSSIFSSFSVKYFS